MKKPGFALLSNSIPGDVILGGLPGFIMLPLGAVQQRANKPLFRLWALPLPSIAACGTWEAGAGQHRMSASGFVTAGRGSS